MEENRYLVKSASCAYHTVDRLPALTHSSALHVDSSVPENMALSGLLLPTFTQEGVAWAILGSCLFLPQPFLALPVG